MLNYKKQVLVVFFALLGLAAQDAGAMEKSKIANRLDRLHQIEHKIIRGLTGNTLENKLHEAVDDSDYDKIKGLIEKGANVNAVVGWVIRLTPLDRALGCRNKEARYAIIKLLLTNGADPNAEDDEHSTPLFKALDYHNLEALKLFFDPTVCKVKPDIMGLNDELSILDVAGYENLEIIKLVVENGAAVKEEHVDKAKNLQKSNDKISGATITYLEMAIDLKNKSLSFENFAKTYLEISDEKAAREHLSDAMRLAKKTGSHDIKHNLYNWAQKSKLCDLVPAHISFFLLGTKERLKQIEQLSKQAIEKIVKNHDTDILDDERDLLFAVYKNHVPKPTTQNEQQTFTALNKPKSYASVFCLQDNSETKIEDPLPGAEDLTISIITGNAEKLGPINLQLATDLYQVKNQEMFFDDFAKLYLDILDLNVAKVNWVDATRLAQKLDDDTLSHLLYDWGVKKYRIVQEKQLEKTEQYDTDLLGALCTTIATTLPDYARFFILNTLEQIKQINIFSSAENYSDNKLTIEKIVEHYDNDDATEKQRFFLSTAYDEILAKKYKDLPALTEKEEYTCMALKQKSCSIYSNSISFLRSSYNDEEKEL